MTRRLACIVAALTLLAAGCSDGDDQQSASDTTAIPTTAGPTSTSEAESDSTVESETPGPLARYADYTPKQYEGTDNWLCHPDADDLCDSDMAATEINTGGATREITWAVEPDAPIDCFYVYPTISGDEGPNSDLEASPTEEGYAARNQVARLGAQCRVLAPVYRQITLSGLAGNVSPEARDMAYDDVLDAWKSYMAQANDGRGVVLIGHSQGASMLRKLMTEEIDPNEDVRDHLVSAYLAGTSVAVPEGEDVGGDFKDIPLCSTPEEVGCVISWSTYRDTAPPPENAFFGRTDQDAMRAACVNPADLSGGEPTELNGAYPSERGGSILAGSDGAPKEPTKENSWVDPEVAVVDTPFVTLPGLVTGQCASNDSTDWLEVTINGDPTDPRADDIGGDLTPEWGLHLLDVNLVMDDIQGLVTTQANTYEG